MPSMQPTDKRMSAMSGRTGGEQSSSPPRKTLSMPRRPGSASGVSPVFSSAPPAGLVQLKERSSASRADSIGQISSKNSSSSISPTTTTESSNTTTATATNGASAASSLHVSFLWRFQQLTARNRRVVVLIESVLVAILFNPPPIQLWVFVTVLILFVAWFGEFLKMLRQLKSSKTVGVAAVLMLQQMPNLRALAVDFFDAGAVYFVCVYIKLVL